MLIESQSKGLVLEFDGSFNHRANIDNLLRVALPTDQNSDEKGVLWSSKVKNGCNIQMADLGKIHSDSPYGTRYGIHLNRNNNFWLRKKDRRPFIENGKLQGYCEFGACNVLVLNSVLAFLTEH